jgi:molybdate transport system substrate-binding protein
MRQRSVKMTEARVWIGVVAAAVLASRAAHSETVEIFSAGSLRGVVADISKDTAAFGVEAKPIFGGSGALRERIENGAAPDLFLSADVGSPRKLEARGRTVVPIVAFARNRMCVVSRRSAGVTARNLIDRLLRKDVRVKTATPIADPSGDYAWAIFDRIESLRPGSGAILKQKAQSLMNAKATPTRADQSAAAALFATKQVDLSITYCSASAGLEKELPELTSLVIPAELDPHPVYGMAVLSSKPEAMRLALYLLSEKGQAILVRNGFVPVTEAK